MGQITLKILVDKMDEIKERSEMNVKQCRAMI